MAKKKTKAKLGRPKGGGDLDTRMHVRITPAMRRALDAAVRPPDKPSDFIRDAVTEKLGRTMES